jgi:microcystin-dependent protein
MLVTNLTGNDYWFGPLHLPGGDGQQITIDDTSETSLYLTNDTVADAINNLYHAAKITVTDEAQPFPRPTGTPTLIHGDGSPEGLVYAPQGSMYMRRDGTLTNGGVLYLKTTGITINTGWLDLATASGAEAALPTGTINAYGGSSAPDGWLLCDGTAISREAYSTLFGVIGTSYGTGDGSTTFNLPDLRGRVPVGLGTNADVSTLGGSEGGAEANRSPRHNSTNSLTLPDHTHSLTDPGHNHDWSGQIGASSGTNKRTWNPGSDFTSSVTTQTTGITVGNPSSNPAISGSIGPGGSRPTDTPAYLVVNYIIKT